MKLKRRITDGERAKFIFFLIGCTLIPAGYFIYNSNEILVWWKIKEWMRMRWDWLDKEHGINREEYFKTMKEIDEVYWVTEKEEWEQLLKLGKVPEK